MNTKHAKENRQILEEASGWFVDFRLGKLDKGGRREFMGWLKRSPEHIRAYMEISGAYARLPNGSTAQAADIERLIERASSRSNVVPLDSAAEADIVASVQSSGYQRYAARPPAALLGVSIALVCICIVVGAWFVLTRAPTYATEIAEHRSITLEDGSRVDLNARTRLRIVFTSNQRRIDLLEGQALFHVAKDARRPFIVSSAGTEVRAVGTRFDVHLRQSGTIVTVLEGRVAVLDRQARTPAGPKAMSDIMASGAKTDAPRETTGAATAEFPIALILSAGEQAIITPTRIERPQHANTAAVTSWTEGEFEFDETPLADVVEEFNRYNRVPILIDSQALKDFRISGVYSTEDPLSLIRFLRNQPDLIVTETEHEIRIQQR
jgi:transmembrane sensor